jgi:hypothetical protein
LSKFVKYDIILNNRLSLLKICYNKIKEEAVFMKCSQCGSEINEGEAFCTSCGAPVENQQAQNNQTQSEQASYSQGEAPQMNQSLYGQYGQPQYGQPQYGQPANNQDGFDYTPISMWGYFGYEILFSIPCVGLILLLVFSFGGTKNINLRNFARSYFCFLIIAAIIVAIICLVAGVGLIGGTTYSSVYY